jgi:hypothetical protein
MADSKRCGGCGERTTASGPYCRTCQSKRFHARQDIKAGKYILDQVGGAWWVWTDKGEVVVIGRETKELAFHCLAHGDPLLTETDESEATP